MLLIKNPAEAIEMAANACYEDIRESQELHDNTFIKRILDEDDFPAFRALFAADAEDLLENPRLGIVPAVPQRGSLALRDMLIKDIEGLQWGLFPEMDKVRDNLFRAYNKKYKTTVKYAQEYGRLQRLMNELAHARELVDEMAVRTY